MQDWAPGIRLRDVSLQEVGRPRRSWNLGDMWEAAFIGRGVARGPARGPGASVPVRIAAVPAGMGMGSFDLAFGDFPCTDRTCLKPRRLIEAWTAC